MPQCDVGKGTERIGSEDVAHALPILARIDALMERCTAIGRANSLSTLDRTNSLEIGKSRELECLPLIASCVPPNLARAVLLVRK